MRVPIKWLSEFVPISHSPQELAELFTIKGVEVNNILRIGEKIKDYIVAEVKSATSSKAIVADGKNILEVSAPAFNLKSNDKVAYNPKEAKLLTPAIAEISQNYQPVILEDDWEIGRQLLDYLDDYVLDLEILPNRGDLMSIIGIARELASYQGLSIKIQNHNLKIKSSDKFPINDYLKLQVDKLGCFDYIARLIFDVKVAPSPFWLQWRLTAVGLRPINNIVDATNYIMIKYGTPLHAFDYEKITGRTINVRFAKKGEKIKALDGNNYDLNESVLLIADKESPIALAGIMGGIDTEITDTTTKVLLECARFNPKVIRKGSKSINLATEASQRFEMGIDNEILDTASLDASNLIATLGQGTVLGDKIEIRTVDKPKTIPISLKKINALLGITLNKRQIKKTLNNLNCITDEQNNQLIVKIPSYRLDLVRDVDLIEEIARIYGYDRLPSCFALKGKEPGCSEELSNQISIIKDFFIGSNFIENYTVSFCDEKYAKMFTDIDTVIKIPLPLNERYAYLRPMILVTLLESVQINFARGNRDLKLFEVGKVFTQNKELSEKWHIAAVISGQKMPTFWQKELNVVVDYFDIKGIVESFFEFLKIKDISFVETKHKFLDKNQALIIKCADIDVGWLGEISQSVLDRYDIVNKVYGLELDIEKIIKFMPSYRYFQFLPKFPLVTRDFAFIVDDKISVEKIKQSIVDMTGALLESIEVFDYFGGPPLPAGKHNLGIRIALRSQERTLTQNEINKIFDRILVSLKEELNITLRGESASEDKR